MKKNRLTMTCTFDSLKKWRDQEEDISKMKYNFVLFTDLTSEEIDEIQKSH